MEFEHGQKGSKLRVRRVPRLALRLAADASAGLAVGRPSALGRTLARQLRAQGPRTTGADCPPQPKKTLQIVNLRAPGSRAHFPVMAHESARKDRSAGRARGYRNLWTLNIALALLLSACGTVKSRPLARPAAMPLYQHIFVIVDENKGYQELMDDHPGWAPALNQLANEYGSATQFYGEVHSSEGDYIAMLGGDTFGINDDDAFYCHAGVKDAACEDSNKPGYPDHDLIARSLMDQLAAKHLTWKAYLESIPAAGSLAARWPTPENPSGGRPNELYSAKHDGFVSFEAVNRASNSARAGHLVGFDQLKEDLARDSVPNYAHIIPNECNDMHGLTGPNVPADCEEANSSAVVRRGDAEIAMLVNMIIHSKVWSDPGNAAIVVTFDENDRAERHSGEQGCCGYDPHSVANFGGGHIPTIVITNHGPRHLVDDTPYNHYSLLRTTEAAFGMNEYLGHAADKNKGVEPMTPLFAVR